MKSIKNIRKCELIGLQISVVDATNPALIGIEGRVIDETKNTIVVENNKKWTLIKEQVVIQTMHDNQSIRIDGDKLTKRPEDRIKER